MDRPLTLLIKRKSRWEEFQVRISEQAYVLDALEVAWRQDPSLLFHHSCHHASCGSCGMRIQGREGLACITPVFRVAPNGMLRLEPLRNFPVVADLVVDMSPLADKLEGVKAQAVAIAESSQRFVNCIECGLCISACPIAGTSRDYLGPAVLAAAERNLDDPEIRVQVQGQHGVWRCHSAFECSEVCPAGVEPGSAIMRMRKDLIVSMIRRRRT